MNEKTIIVKSEKSDLVKNPGIKIKKKKIRSVSVASFFIIDRVRRVLTSRTLILDDIKIPPSFKFPDTDSKRSRSLDSFNCK